MKLFDVLPVVLPVLAALLLGWYSRRHQIIGESAVNGLKTLVMRFMLPSVLLGSFYKANFNQLLVVMAVCMFLCCFAGLWLGKAVAKICRIQDSMFPFLTCGFEAGMMGYGLYAMLFPASETHNFALVDLGQVLFVFTVYSALLNKQKGLPTKQTLREMVASPVFLAIAAGILLSSSGLGALIHQSRAGASIDAVLNYIGAPTGVLMIFVVGYQLVLNKVGLRAAFFTVAARTAIMAGLCICCLTVLRQFFVIPPPLFWAIILMFTLPAPFVLPIFCGDEAQESYIATTLSVGTIFSVAYFAVISFLC